MQEMYARRRTVLHHTPDYTAHFLRGLHRNDPEMHKTRKNSENRVKSWFNEVGHTPQEIIKSVKTVKTRHYLP